MDNLKAFGAGMTGGQFDHKTFLRKPTVICRIGAAILGAGLWFAMYKGGWTTDLVNKHTQVCLFNLSSTTCSFVSAMGFFSLLAALALLASDVQFDKISAIQTRSRVVRADMATSAFFAFIFILMFINTFSKFSSMTLYDHQDGRWAKMAILMAFLAIIAWAGAAFLAWRRFQASEAEAPFQQGEYQTDFQTVPGDVAAGYGYGGNSDGIGSVAGTTAFQGSMGAAQAPGYEQPLQQQQHNQSYQQQAPPPMMQQQQQYQAQPMQQQQHYQQPMQQQGYQQQMPPQTNPFANQGGYQY